MLNKLMLIGRVGKEPDLKTSQTGNPLVILSVVTNEHYKDQQGQKKEIATWHRVVFFGKVANNICQCLTKGSEVYIECKLRNNSSIDAQGKKMYSIDLLGTEIKFLSFVKTNQQTNQAPRISPSHSTMQPVHPVPQVQSAPVQPAPIPPVQPQPPVQPVQQPAQQQPFFDYGLSADDLNSDEIPF